jgi:hypothetical protein
MNEDNFQPEAPMLGVFGGHLIRLTWVIWSLAEKHYFSSTYTEFMGGHTQPPT